MKLLSGTLSEKWNRRSDLANIAIDYISYCYMGYKIKQALQNEDYERVKALSLYTIASAMAGNRMSSRIERFNEKY